MRSNCIYFSTPQFSLLSETQIEDLHLASLYILKRTGVRVHDTDGLDLFRRGGADVYSDGLVRIPPNLVEWALRSAPPGVILYSREGSPAIRAEATNVYYGTGPSLPNILDPYTGKRRMVVKQDVANVAKLCDALPNIDFVMSLGIVSDCPDGFADREEFWAMVLNTGKPLVGWAFDLAGCADLVKMGIAVRGSLEELKQYPFFAVLSDPTTPLTHSGEAVQILMYLAQRDLPNLYLSNPIMGASAPVTFAASLALANAELLSGLVLCQLKREGAPFIYSGVPVPMDLRTTVVGTAAPEAIVGAAALTEMAHHYRLPSFSVGGITDSKMFDQQAALEGALAVLTAGLSGANLVHGVGLAESAMTASLEMVVVQDEVIGMVKRMMGGIEINVETLALDLIDEVGPGGHFLATEHTLRHYRENWYPGLMDRGNVGEWEAKGSKTLGQRASEKVKDILEHYQPQPLPEAVQDRLAEIIEEAKRGAPS